ncbi:DUF7210 family protein [Pseudomonas spirodelae]|uniref:DUF7210 domain-containing protein n=1 Tax=Pseudomonas spirodelae TaxID=3101751 RepID=A0ABU5P8E7_9PSED|nr:hypothetical protein [Pseudomonas sp. T5W1]MEA1605738.1 hypothetical protein [Pseudomonas sp. T5W1]
MSKMHQVTLLKDHTHAGVQKRAGETISVSEPARDWLLAQHVIAAQPAAEVAATTSKTGGDK